MRPVLVAALLVVSAVPQAQEIAVGVGYPVPVGNTFLAQYDGVTSASVSVGYPVGGGALVRAGLQYNRVHFDLSRTDADVYTPRLGVARPVALWGPLSVVPEAGLSVTRIRFSNDELPPGYVLSADDQKDGAGFWVGVTPRYELAGRWSVGVPVEYRATFLDVPEEPAADSRYNRQYRALTVSVEGSYRF